MAEIKEVWKPVKDYEELYEVSNLGRVRGIRRGIVLRGFPNKRNGYHQVMLYDDNLKNKLCYTHRIVAEAFLPQPLNGEVFIFHLDGNKMNNAASNLMWKCISAKKNLELGIPDSKIKKMKKECAYIIRRYNKDGICMAEYNNWEMLENLGYKKHSIMMAARNAYPLVKNSDMYKHYKWSIEKKD